MRLRRRIEAVAAAVVGETGCPGPGVVTRLAFDDEPDPPPCPACGGCHVLVIDEVVIEAGEAAGDAG